MDHLLLVEHINCQSAMSAPEVPPQTQQLSRQPDNPGKCTTYSIRALAAVGGISKCFLHCSLLKTGSYACQMSGRQEVNAFIVDQSQTTLIQLQADDTNIEHQCNLR